MFRFPRTGGFARVVLVAYPVSDVVIIAVALSVFSRYRAPGRRAFALLVAGQVFLALSDSSFTYFAQKSPLVYLNVIDSGWVIGFFLIALAALSPLGHDGYVLMASTSDRRFALRSLLPPLSVLSAIGAVVAYGIAHGHLHAFLAVVGPLVIVLLLVRQALAVAENQALARKLDSTIERLRDREETLLNYTLHDPLTGLANRLLLDDRRGQALGRHGPSHPPIAVLVCDLDRFKRVNDTLGHPTGDRALRAVANTASLPHSRRRHARSHRR